ncbi:MAG: sugar phosphate isomerase/epimerase [Clostridiales bacterium]|jgi:sugar phosphate isomerase/epimerase|nr:sugar phosphate isomerase/epimerase [Clostridiales bacterium]
MKLGVLTVPLYSKPAEEAFAILAKMGVEALEIGTGGSPGSVHLNPAEFLGNPGRVKEYKDMVKGLGLEISAFSCHGNAVHPNKEIAKKAHDEFVQTCQLAELFEIGTVVTFSGCPGGTPDDKYSNWVTCTWPSEFSEILKYQWDDVLIPYWSETAKLAKTYGVERIALEMHPGFCVYNTRTLLKLRAAAGDAIGANFDPSHLLWQGIYPPDAIRALKGAIYHFHAKDTKINQQQTRINGVLETSGYDEFLTRSWLFRTVGYGNDAGVWKDIISSLKTVGYDGIISIEHEDGLMSVDEGLQKAVDFLKGIIIKENPADMWWL